ncbi:hypothetical protein H310_12507 [Aphanomyces invadans]|uniref:Uncharacterized protein n=1 Tax=Aphanomyces invadans TaxID=157072 RepID=A0A024TIP5_9STRA|nr:hypothetical protein H310_12507 [Aphanomyces invadans]ETV93456.1 hypothetical protein H310_12507 [Aphanomyces invadans]|eukprot:XP_008877798.1 hypothetical protein H310_12507 [Aphanomyces invadans]
MSVAGLTDGDSSCTYASKPKRAKSLRQLTTHLSTTMAASASTLPRTAHEILGIMKALKLDDVARHFDKDDDDIDPYVVCEGVSVDAFNAYVGDGEGLRVALRFLDLSGDERIFIVELPTRVHESTSEKFKTKFLSASGNEGEVAQDRPTTSGKFRRRNGPNPPAVDVMFDMHRILSIPAHQALPGGVNPVIVVNLRTVMDQVIDCLC